MHDELLLAEPLLTTTNGHMKAKIIGRKRDQDGQLVGHYNSNLILNTRVYLAEFPDGTVSEYAANIIAEAIYEQVNDDGYDTVVFADIISHQYQPTTGTVSPFAKVLKT